MAGSHQEVKDHDDEVGLHQFKGDKNTPADEKRSDSSDEEEEDNQVLRVGNIKEKKDVINKNK